MYISFTTTAIDIVNPQNFSICRNRIFDVGIDFQQQTLGTGHAALITTTVEVTDLTFLKEPSWTNGHIGEVVAAKHAPKLKRTFNRCLRRIQIHLMNTVSIKQFLIPFLDAIYHYAGIIDTNRGVFSHRSIVATTKELAESTTINLEIGLSYDW